MDDHETFSISQTLFLSSFADYVCLRVPLLLRRAWRCVREARTENRKLSFNQPSTLEVAASRSMIEQLSCVIGGPA